MTVAERVSTSQLRDSLRDLAPLFEYPTEAYLAQLDHARAAVAAIDEGAAHDLERFVDEIRPLDRGALESAYTKTFDLAPSCLPYLGAHVFEAESRDRARLMVGLRMSYRDGGYEIGTELPDHVAEVLRFAPSFVDGDWQDLLRLVLLPGLEKMQAALGSTTNPFRHLVVAVGRLCRTAVEGVAS